MRAQLVQQRQGGEGHAHEGSTRFALPFVEGFLVCLFPESNSKLPHMTVGAVSGRGEGRPVASCTDLNRLHGVELAAVCVSVCPYAGCD